MKILIYGAGVIGCYLTHVLCAAGNDVTLLARGIWRETLERDGLTIVHHLQKKTTHDRPRIIGALNGEHYDLVFAVMQYPAFSSSHTNSITFIALLRLRSFFSICKYISAAPFAL